MAASESKSWLPSGFASPWPSNPSSRAATPKPPMTAGAVTGEGQPGQQQGGDHILSHRHWVSLKRYPPDCPPLNARWFYAVDVPKRKPLPVNQAPKPDAKPPPPPKKFVPFTVHDSRTIETVFQRLLDEDYSKEQDPKPFNDDSKSGIDLPKDGSKLRNSTLNQPGGETEGGRVKVPVNEDYLFDVDIQRRELAPVYWLGPVYDVKRGTWFYQDGPNLRPCEENLAAQLEEGYLKVKPFRYVAQATSVSQTKSRPTSVKPGETFKPPNEESARILAPEASADDLKNTAALSSAPNGDFTPQTPVQPMQTYRLFGAHMNSVVTYQDATTAWIVSDDFLTRMSSTVYQRFAGGAYFSGVKIIRGYSKPGKSKEVKIDGDKRPITPSTPQAKTGPESLRTTKTETALKRHSAPPSSLVGKAVEMEDPLCKAENPRQKLERKMSSLVSSDETLDREEEEEEARKRDEKEMEDDYRDDHGEEQGRKIEHLILVTHGIGQRLGLRLESVNFIHDVNVLRKTLKDVYSTSADLQALNKEVDKLPKNCRIQVLPVSWRHLLDFPTQSIKQNRKELDLGDAAAYGEEDEYPSLVDITVEGVPAVRGLITDLALDILLYQSAYREHISGIVLRECNRIYKIFCGRNPSFKGSVSLCGHSLGSAILFDILCRQKDDETLARSSNNRKQFYHNRPGITSQQGKELRLDFPVESFFCLGSPIGLFQMLKGRTVAARRMPDAFPSESPLNPDMDDPFLSSSFTAEDGDKSTGSRKLPFTVSSPKCGQLYNIFHPTDPIAYRLEPLISPAMTALKPQPLPYTKRGIFGTPMAQGLTGISTRVGQSVSQSVSGLWSSLSAGIASSILQRSLGITSEELKGGGSTISSSVPLSPGAGTNIAGGVISSAPTGEAAAALTDQKKRNLANETLTADELGQHAPTLIDDDLQTLYAGFQKARKSQQEDGDPGSGIAEAEWDEAEERGRKLRKEEMKVRALNATGRVDFSIQEGVFDISLIASIASHLSYWGDEDVSHFILSQLLSRHRSLRRVI